MTSPGGTRSPATTASPAEPCLALCEVLEREYEEITGDELDPPPSWVFTPDQILEPRRLARRLLDGHDLAARELCHTIVVSDGGCDPCATFEDLGNAVRKIRIDLGIPIEFTEMAIHAREGSSVAEPGKYCAIGTIGYSCVDEGAEDGVLLYLKPAFYGDEPKDVFNYARTSTAFPHEPTGDQFFSESQFESYRALGSHVIDQILDRAPAAAGIEPLTWLAMSASQYASRAPGAIVAKPPGQAR